MEELIKHVSEIPSVVLMAVVFLVFLLQLLKFSFELVNKNFEKKEKSKEREANTLDGTPINHLAIFEKLGSHHALLEKVADDLEKLNNSFATHVQDDHKSLNLILSTLQGKRDKPVPRKKKRSQ